MVRLKAFAEITTGRIIARFNSLMVRLKATAGLAYSAFNNRFNSLMVRLKDYASWVCQYLCDWFQFLDGAIKSERKT